MTTRQATPRRVLHFAWSGTIGGAPRALYMLIRSQVENGDVPTLALAAVRGPYVEKVKSLGVEVIDLDFSRDLQLWRSGSLISLVSSFDYHHFHSAELTMGLASLRSPNVCRIYTHRSARTSYPSLRRIRYKSFGVMLRRGFHGFSGNTRAAVDAGVSLFSIERNRWRLTYNGLYFDDLVPMRDEVSVCAELGVTSPGRYLIATSAQLRSGKRTDRLLRAAARLDDVPYTLMVLGDGPGRESLEILADSLGIEDRVVFTGFKEDVADYLAAADLFVLPTGSAESFGNSAVEAMALGVPTIVMSDGGGLLEHIQHGETGMIADGLQGLVSCIRYLYEDPQRAARIGTAGKEFVRSRYTPEKMHAAYDHLYESATAE